MKVFFRMLNPFNLVKFTLFLTCLGLSVSLTCSNVLAETKKKPAKKVNEADSQRTPEATIKKYIFAYQTRTLTELIFCDAGMYKVALTRRDRAPESLKKSEFGAGMLESVEYFEANENDKLANGTLLENTIQMFGGSGSIPFFKVLYREMSYKILEVRNKTVNGPFDEGSRHSKEAFVELSYSNPDLAPSDKGQKVKKAVVRVKLEAWPGKGGGSIYLVQGYDVTKYSREYF